MRGQRQPGRITLYGYACCACNVVACRCNGEKVAQRVGAAKASLISPCNSCQSGGGGLDIWCVSDWNGISGMSNPRQIRPASVSRYPPAGEGGKKTVKLINKQAVLEYLTAPGPEELASWCQENSYGGVDPTRDPGRDDMPSDHILAAALWHAREKFPGATDLDVCSYAGLVAYLATGWYGGFGTDEYEKERQAENIVLALAGGIVAEPDGFVATVPESVIKETPSAEFTRQVLVFLDAFYFGDQEQAVADLLDGVDDLTVARIVLGMARTQAEYDHLARAADGFLKKKGNLAALRKAVREVLRA